ncbi:GGDEF domain-containing protein [Thiomicrorhabdus hydrogeniphila]
MNGVLWIDYLIQNTEKQNKISIIHNGKNIVFQVKARLLKQASNEYVVVLNNITESETLNQKLHQLSLIDELTQVGNRRSFNETLQRELMLSKRNGFNCSLISFDIDHFKQVNDNYGHAVGDEVLKHIALTSRLQIRSTDRLFRVGGEEFIILLPMQGHDEAEIVAEKIRKKIASTHFEPVGQITASFGVIESHHEDDISSLLIRVDEAMYLAKESGRNRVKVIKHG